MIAIRNLQFQLLTFNLAGDKTLHLGSRGLASIPQKDLSAELMLAEKRGLVSFSKPDEGKSSASSQTSKRRK